MSNVKPKNVTIQINEELFKVLRKIMIDNGWTWNQLLGSALRLWLKEYGSKHVLSNEALETGKEDV